MLNNKPVDASILSGDKMIVNLVADKWCMRMLYFRET